LLLLYNAFAITNNAISRLIVLTVNLNSLA